MKISLGGCTSLAEIPETSTRTRSLLQPTNSSHLHTFADFDWAYSLDTWSSQQQDSVSFRWFFGVMGSPRNRPLFRVLLRHSIRLWLWLRVNLFGCSLCYLICRLLLSRLHYCFVIIRLQFTLHRIPFFLKDWSTWSWIGIRTQLQFANLFTKPLASNVLFPLSSKTGVLNNFFHSI